MGMAGIDGQNDVAVKSDGQESLISHVDVGYIIAASLQLVSYESISGTKEPIGSAWRSSNRRRNLRV